jgi:hypothetical protein
MACSHALLVARAIQEAAVRPGFHGERTATKRSRYHPEEVTSPSEVAPGPTPPGPSVNGGRGQANVPCDSDFPVSNRDTSRSGTPDCECEHLGWNFQISYTLYIPIHEAKGRYPIAELHVERTRRTGRYKRSVKLTILLPEGQSRNLFDELKAAFRKPRKK